MTSPIQEILPGIALPINEKTQVNGVFLFDGACSFCSSWVNYLAEKLQNSGIIFIPQNEAWNKILSSYLNKEVPDSLIFIEKQQVYFYNEAIKKGLAYSPFKNPLKAFLSLTPQNLQKYIYIILAKHRYKFSRNKKAPQSFPYDNVLKLNPVITKKTTS